MSESPDRGLTPAQRIEPGSPDLLRAGIVTIPDMATLQECVAHENQHQQRVQILKRLSRRADELRAADETSQ